MSERDDSGPAYPLPEHLTWPQADSHGMSLRDAAAIQFQAALLMTGRYDDRTMDAANIAQRQAHAFLKARKS